MNITPVCRRLAFFVLPLTISSFGLCATLPVAEDSSSSKGQLTKATNAATTLKVDSSHSAYLYFDLSEVPVASGAQVRYARLRLYFPKVTSAGSGLEVHAITGQWDEGVAGPAPTQTPEVIATIPGGQTATKRFASVDVTEAVRAWIDGSGVNEGFAVAAGADANLLIAAKEGTGTGYPAELEVELNPGSLPAGTVDSASLGSDLTLGGTTKGVFSGSFIGNGSSLTSLSTGNLTGLLSNSQLANNSFSLSLGSGLSGSTSVDLGGTMTLNNTGVLSLQSGGGITVSKSTGEIVLGSSATSDNTPDAIVQRDNNGDFSAGKVSATSFKGAGALLWQAVTGTAQNAETNTGYLAMNGVPVTVTLPASAQLGDIVRVTGVGAGGWQLLPNVGQSISGYAAGQGVIGAQGATAGVQYIGNNQWQPISELLVAAGAINTAQIANGAITNAQLAANAVQAGNIATGAVGTSQLAAGAVTADQIASGTITQQNLATGSVSPDKLTKPVRTGTIASSSLSLDFTGGVFSAPFNPPFATTPNVVLTMDAGDGTPGSKARLNVTGRSASQFNGTITSGGTDSLVTVSTQTLDGSSTAASYTGTSYFSARVVNGNPAVCYYDGGNIKFVRATDASGTAWGTPVTIDKGYYIASLAVVNGNPALVYLVYNNSGWWLNYVRANDANGSSWGTPLTLDTTLTGNSVESACLVVVSGNPAIAETDVANNRIKYVRSTDANGTAWGGGVIPTSSAQYITNLSLAVVNGNPALAYENGNRVTYVRASDALGATWGTPVTVDGTTYNSSAVTLIVVNGNPAIGYADDSAGDLRFVRSSDANGATWAAGVTVESAGSVGRASCMSIINGNPAFGYVDSTGPMPLYKYVRATDANGATWGSSVVLDVGWYASAERSSLITVNGNPAVVYNDYDAGDIKYARSSDVNGSAWAAGSTLTGVTAVGSYSNAEMINGNPAVSYYDATNHDLKYVRANDAAGSTWDTPVVVDSTGVVGQYNSMATVNGYPAISYYDATNRDVKFVRALDSAGTTWGTPVVAVSAGNVGIYTSLQVVNGRPAIAYLDQSNVGLKFVQAADLNGATWGSPVMVQAGATSNYPVVLAVVNDNPLIGWGSSIYRAADANGASWASPVAAGLNVDCITTVNGNPAVCGQGYSNGLMFNRANDQSGSSWGAAIPVIANISVGYNTTTLAVTSGKPTIALNGKFVRADDINGNSWGTPLVFPNYSVTPGSLLSVNGVPMLSAYDYSSRSLKFLQPGAPALFNIVWMALEP